MPSKSAAQARLMAAVAHSPEFAKKVGIPVKVGKDFNQADKGRKFKEGGATMATKKMDTESKKEFAFMKAKGAPKSMVKAEMKEEGYKCGGKVKKMARGGGIETKGKTRGKFI